MTDAELLRYLDRLQRATTDLEWLVVENHLEALPASVERDALLRCAIAMRTRRSRRN